MRVVGTTLGCTVDDTAMKLFELCEKSNEMIPSLLLSSTCPTRQITNLCLFGGYVGYMMDKRKNDILSFTMYLGQYGMFHIYLDSILHYLD